MAFKPVCSERPVLSLLKQTVSVMGGVAPCQELMERIACRRCNAHL
jgi:hypothetical protein